MVVAICSVLWLLFVEDQVMVTEFKDEDPDPLVNAATGTPKDYTKQSYEDQESDPPVIAAAGTSTDHNPP